MFKRLTKRLREYFSCSEWLKPSEWVKTLDLSGDISAPYDRVDLSLTPYIIAPLDEWDFSGQCKEVTVVAIEQSGKSSSWVWGLLWSFIYKPCLSIVTYPTDPDAAEANDEKLIPLMKKVPELREEVNAPHAKTKDHFRFSNLISYFRGSGSPVISKSAKIRVGDEVDDWVKNQNRVDNIKNLRKRARAHHESLLYLVCSPTFETGLIWQSFRSSSRGYWHLRCQGCGKLTMRSCDIHNLKFEKENGDDGIKVPVRGSIRLICPKCGYSHGESQKRKMNIEGDYIHEVPALRKTNPGYQWGALASQFESLNWFEIAKVQLKAGHSGNIEDQKYFDNSFRGIPLQRRKITGELEEKLLTHCMLSEPDPEAIEAVFLTIDTQMLGWKWEIRALDINCNYIQLAYGFSEYLELTDDEREVVNKKREAEQLPPVRTIEDVLYSSPLGIEILLALIDEGGHRKKEVKPFVMKHEKLYSYKGDNKIGSKWKFSDKEDQDKLILARANEFQSDLLYYLYVQKNPDNNFWYFLPQEQVSAEYLAEVAAIRKNEDKPARWGFEFWEDNGRVHDYFDTSKMFLVILEVAIDDKVKGYWQHGQAEILGFKQNEKIKESDPPQNTTSAINKSSWVTGYLN